MEPSANAWRQRTARSWEREDGALIVKDHCPRRGGTYYKRVVGYVVTFHRTLEDAQA